MTELVEEHMAQANYQIKVQAKQFSDMMMRFNTSWREAGGSQPRQ
jgi:hypothetical protein